MLQTLLVFGEGPTDLGCSRNAQAYPHGADLEIGPILRLVHRLLLRHLPEWNADVFNKYQEHAIPSVMVAAAEMKSLVKHSAFKFPSKKTKPGYLIHSKRAAVLGTLAQQADQRTHAEIAIYFHDTDGTNSEPHSPLDLEHAVNEGFRASGFAEKGVAMIPQPTSEAWLICHCKPNSYQHCTLLETQLSGNDRSPLRSPKQMLGNYLNKPAYHRGDLMTVVDNIELDRLDMPTFNRFRHALCNAIDQICGNHIPAANT